MRKSYSQKSVIYNESIILQIENKNFFNSKNRRKKITVFIYAFQGVDFIGRESAWHEDSYFTNPTKRNVF